MSIEAVLHNRREPGVFWAGGIAPDWADDWGEDDHGKWVTFSVEGEDGERVTQRLRWIPPGWFLMGSPEGEAGRWEAEGPQHEVTIGRGFWLFDTPVTQALWAAVMGESDNPSRFRTPNRPVEQVSWDDVQRFLERINARVPGLELVLPSEAQWEYACRAGTETATYAGNLEILGERNAPVLDAIAWYSGNSGVGFELAEGEDSSSWPAKQHPHERAGMRPVGLKGPNPCALARLEQRACLMRLAHGLQAANKPKPAPWLGQAKRAEVVPSAAKKSASLW